jgi:transcriptional regulator GlxA family with amidase domain
VRHCIALQTPVGASRWSHANFTILGGLDVVSLLEPPPRIDGKIAERIGDLNAELAALKQGRSGALEQAVRRKSLGLLLLLQVFEAAGLREKAEWSASLLQQHQRLAGVLGYVAANLSRRITLDELARQAHLSPSRFHAVFRTATGQAPRDYVLRLRLRKAQELLLTTDLAVKEIAARVGVADPFFLSRIFSQKCGVSPSEYRQAARLTAL